MRWSYDYVDLLIMREDRKKMIEVVVGAHNKAVDALAAEADELQRRLDAVVALCKECDPAMNSYYLISCLCGWKGSSSECDGGEAIGDSGDWSDIECPVCKRQDPPTLHARAIAIAEGRA